MTCWHRVSTQAFAHTHPRPNSHHGLLLHWLGEAATPRALVLLCHLQAQVVQHQHRMRACVRQREGMGKHLMRVTSDWDVSGFRHQRDRKIRMQTQTY